MKFTKNCLLKCKKKEKNTQLSLLSGLAVMGQPDRTITVFCKLKYSVYTGNVQHCYFNLQSLNGSYFYVPLDHIFKRWFRIGTW